MIFGSSDACTRLPKSQVAVCLLRLANAVTMASELAGRRGSSSPGVLCVCIIILSLSHRSRVELSVEWLDLPPMQEVTYFIHTVLPLCLPESRLSL